MPEQGGLARERCPTNMAPEDLDMGCVHTLFLFMHPLLVAAREPDGTVRALVRLSSEMDVDVAVEVDFARVKVLRQLSIGQMCMLGE
jgi:methylglyoxal synthase